jgi:hypothetical protein
MLDVWESQGLDLQPRGFPQQPSIEATALWEVWKQIKVGLPRVQRLRFRVSSAAFIHTGAMVISSLSLYRGVVARRAGAAPLLRVALHPDLAPETPGQTPEQRRQAMFERLQNGVDEELYDIR